MAGSQNWALTVLMPEVCYADLVTVRFSCASVCCGGISVDDPLLKRVSFGLTIVR